MLCEHVYDLILLLDLTDKAIFALVVILTDTLANITLLVVVVASTRGR